MQEHLSMNVAMDAGMVGAMSNDLAGRILRVRKQAGLSQEKFAEALGEVEGVKVTRGAVGNWELGKGISRANLRAIANKFEVPLDWLELNKGDPFALPTSSKAVLGIAHTKDPAQGNQAQNASFGGPVSGFFKIPLRGQSMGGKSGSLIFEGNDNLGDVLAPPALAGVPGAYAVYVIGDSMLERFRHGEVVYVHPHMPVRKGDDCVVQIQMADGERHGWVKRFVSMDAKLLKLVQLHPKKTMSFPRKSVISVHKVVFTGPVG